MAFKTWFRIACVSLACALAFAANAQGSKPGTLVVISPGGQLQTVLKELGQTFEKDNGVKIEWVSASASTEIVAKIAASKAAPEYDVAFEDDLSLRAGSELELWAPIDEKIVTNYHNILPNAVQSTKDGVPYGLFYGIMFYNAQEFKKNNWPVPTSWFDLLKPEYCGKSAFFHPNISYGVNALIMLSGGDVNKIDDGIAKLADKRNCFPSLETAVAKFEEKVQLGNYVIGTIPNIRAIALVQKGVPIVPLIPKEGTVIGAATLAAVKNPKNPERVALAQKFVNFVISPPVQAQLMKTMYFSPVNSQVPLSEEMAKAGMLSAERIKAMPASQPGIVVKNRQAWARSVDRAMAR